ncbi:MAG: hypothetical protein WC586_04465 [Methanoregula sp.]
MKMKMVILGEFRSLRAPVRHGGAITGVPNLQIKKGAALKKAQRCVVRQERNNIEIPIQIVGIKIISPVFVRMSGAAKKGAPRRINYR